MGAALHWDIFGILGLLVLSRYVASVVYYLLCKHVVPALKKPRFHRAGLRAVLSFGGWVTVSNLVDPIMTYLDRFMIGSLLTLDAVAYYSTPYEMVTRLWIIPRSFISTLLPTFSTLNGQNSWEQLEAYLTRSVKYLLLALGPIVAAVVVFSSEILQIWLGTEFSREGASVLRILALGVLANSLANIPYSLLQALGRPDVSAKFHLIELPLHCLLAWLLINSWGVTGAAVAWLMRASLDAVLLFIAVFRLFPLNTQSLVNDKTLQVGGVLVAFGGLTATSSFLAASAWVRLVLLVLALSITMAVCWSFFLDDKERAYIMGRSRR